MQHDAKRWHLLILIALFISVAALRIGLAYQSPLPDYDAYEQLRHVRSIQETGKPLYQDTLSFGGRERAFSPLYQYFLALLGLALPELWLVKVVPNLLAAMIVFPAYKIGKHLTEKKSIGLITAGITGLIPATFLIGLNDASPVMASITLTATATYLFMKSKRAGNHLRWLIATTALLVALHPTSVVFLLGLAVYVALLQVLQMKTTGKDVEFLLFTLFLTTWFSLLIYKKAIVAHGGRVIWQNIPSAELAAVFSQVTLLQAIAGAGLITLVIGSYSLYDAIMRAERKPLILLAGMAGATLILIWFRLIALNTGLAMLGIFLAIASAHAIDLFLPYLEKTKAARWTPLIVIGVIVLFVATGFSTVMDERLLNTPTQADVQVMSWAAEHLSEDAIILASPREGSMIAFIANRGTVIDNNYLLVPRVEERYADAQRTYTLFFKTDALSLMQKYGATHLYLSVQAKAFSGVLQPAYIDDECFRLVRTYRDEKGFRSWLYERTCRIGGEAGA